MALYFICSRLHRTKQAIVDLHPLLTYTHSPDLSHDCEAATASRCNGYGLPVRCLTSRQEVSVNVKKTRQKKKAESAVSSKKQGKTLRPKRAKIPSELQKQHMIEVNIMDRAIASANTRREAVKSLPVIDLSAFVSNSSEAARDEAAKALRNACINTGFFYISGHGISYEELKKSVSLSRAFFTLPLDIKMNYRAKSMAEPGFIRVGGVNPDNADAKVTDIKERFSMNRGMPSQAEPHAITSHWPSEQVLPEFSNFMQAHLRKRHALASALFHAFARSLWLPEDYFEPYFKETSHASLINYYPRLNEEALARNQWSFAPHTDYGAFTILSQDSIGGLQVRNFAGEWIEVPPIEGTFVINIGDLMARWTNDLYTSNLHRAKNVSGAARVSIPFFVTPHPDAFIECIDTCKSDERPQLYPGVPCGEYIQELVARSNATGRPGVSGRTSERLKA